MFHKTNITVTQKPARLLNKILILNALETRNYISYNFNLIKYETQMKIFSVATENL
jgi:hypothetical protein